jgi:D-alanyl-D-alanine carboxypeptidase/D-alanyl-D-alanine-endopeptidase (penicillin-binding protein 4)
MNTMIIRLILIATISISALAINQSEVNKLLNKYNLKKEQVGFYSHFKNENKAGVKINENKLFYPASTLKVLSAYYLLKKLGPEFRFETTAALDGDDLVLDLDGDPYLLSNDIIDMAMAIRDNLKKKKELKNLILSVNLPSLERINNVGLDDQPYNQGLSGFNLNFNRFKAFKAGDKYIARPDINFLNLEKSKKKLGPGEVFKHQETKTEQWLYHEVNKSRYEVPIRNPLYFNAHYLIETLEKFNIKITGNIIVRSQSSGKIIYRNKSEPLLRLIELALEFSNNLFIETFILKATGKTTLEEAAIEIKKSLIKEFPHIGLEKASIATASGLSLDSQITPLQLTKFMDAISDKSFGGKKFISLLSLAGTSGFLARRYIHSSVYEKFFAKTGSIDYVNNICGHYFYKRPLSFCLFINDFNKREKLTGKNNKEQEKLRQEAKTWKRKTDQFLEDFLIMYFKDLDV